MTVSRGQTTYSQFFQTAQIGQYADLALNVLTTFPAAEVINPGRAVELASDGVSVQQVQGTSAAEDGGTHIYKRILGFAVLRTAREGAGAVGVTPYGVGGVAYQLGELVPVLSRGRIYAEWKGTTQVAFSQSLKVYHSSTVSTDRGKVTDAALSTTAGSEVSYLGQAIQTRYTVLNTGPVVLIDVNLPGSPGFTGSIV